MEINTLCFTQTIRDFSSFTAALVFVPVFVSFLFILRGHYPRFITYFMHSSLTFKVLHSFYLWISTEMKTTSWTTYILARWWPFQNREYVLASKFRPETGLFGYSMLYSRQSKRCSHKHASCGPLKNWWNISTQILSSSVGLHESMKRKDY